MTTKQAFEHLTKKDRWYEIIGVTRTHSETLKTRLKKGELREKTMANYLIKAGYTVKPAVWTAPEN